mgnify:CR=1 FL=1
MKNTRYLFSLSQALCATKNTVYDSLILSKLAIQLPEVPRIVA